MCTKKKKICLNMIVKNESHIIEETLRCMVKYIDYWVISDTGSTDNTIEVITKFFEKEKIPRKNSTTRMEKFWAQPHRSPQSMQTKS